MVKIGSVTAEIFLIWTNVARTNVASTNVTMTVGICSRCCDLLVYLNHFNLDFEKESHYFKQVHKLQRIILERPDFWAFHKFHKLPTFVDGWVAGCVSWLETGWQS